MRELRRGQLLLLPLAVASISLLAGCSSNRAPGAPQVYSWSHMEPPIPAAQPLVRREVEDDGKEAQAEPGPRVRTIPDDPSQPWSRNYGAARAMPAVSASEVYTDEPAKPAG